MLTDEFHSSDHLVPSHLGLAYALLVDANPFPKLFVFALWTSLGTSQICFIVHRCWAFYLFYANGIRISFILHFKERAKICWWTMVTNVAKYGSNSEMQIIDLPSLLSLVPYMVPHSWMPCPETANTIKDGRFISPIFCLILKRFLN